MPKGKTSRPYNRKEKQALAHLQHVKDVRDKAIADGDYERADKLTVKAKKIRKSVDTLTNRQFKEDERKSHAKFGKKTGYNTRVNAGASKKPSGSK